MEVAHVSRAEPEVSSPSLVVYPRPLGGHDRVDCYAAFVPGETLGAYVQRVGLAVPSRVIRVEHNGRPVPLALWARLIPRQGDLVIISARAMGGGGGGKVLRTVAMLALVVASVTIPGAGIAGLYSGFGLTGTSLALASAGIMIGGSLLLNALLPPPTPTAAKLGTGQKYESSPTYAISGGRNRSRPWEPMLLVFGRHKVVPDLGANPFTLQVGDNQYLNQVFHFGLQGTTLSLRNLKIGSTPISSYQDVQVEASGATGALSMFPGNVDSIQGFAVSQSDGWISRTTGPGTYSIAVELASRLFRINDSGSISGRTVDVRVQYRRVGDTAWIEQGSIGAVVATHYWSLRLRNDESVQYSYGSVNPLDHTDGDVVPAPTEDGQGRAGVWRWYPHPYSRGLPWQGVAPDPFISPAAPGVRIYGARQEPSRLTVWWNVPEGQYEIRVMKVTADINDSRESNETAVSQIRVYQADRADYTGQCRMAVRIKATGQLNGPVDEFSAEVSAWCPAWNGSAWASAETSNPAWWYLWFARGKIAADGSRVYGCGMTSAQIDIEGIKAWGAWCDANRLTFNFVLDAKMGQGAVLQMIARAGRATPTFQTGKLGVVWDAANLPEVAMFGPFNVKAGSFRVDYINDGTVDEIVANFVNASRGWVMDEVRAKVPGSLASNNPLQIDLDGVDNADQAGREANLLAAAQVWRRRRISWETDIEGLTSTRGDVVRFSHDLTEWGYSGRMMPGSGGTTVRLQRSVPSAGSGTMLLRDPGGNMKVVTVTSAVGEVDEVKITTDLGGFPMPGDPGLYEGIEAFDWAWQFDPLATPGRRFKITSVRPAGDGLRFEAVDDDPEYYASESDPFQYTPPRDGALLAGIVMVITGAEQIVNVATDQVRFTLGWVLSSDSDSLVSVLVNGLPRVSQVTSGRSLDLMVTTGDLIDVTVTPRRSTGSGEPKRQSFTIQGLLAPLPAVTGLQSLFRDGLTWLTWDRVQDPREPAYEVRRGSTWADSEVVATTAATEQIAVGNGLYWVAARFVASGGAVIYGAPDSLLIAGATLERNVILVKDEAPDWLGQKEGGALAYGGMLTLRPQGDILALDDVLSEPDVLWLGGPEASGVYTIREADRVDIGYVAAVRVDFHISFIARNLTENILSVADVLALADVLNGSDRQFVRVRPQIRYGQAEGDWTEWRDYVPGLLNARYFDVRLLLETSDPNIVPFVDEFTWSIDVPDLIQHAEAVAVPTGGLDVVYPKRFHAVPNVQITLLDAQAADQVVLTDSTEEGFHIQVKSGATPVARAVNWIAQGY